MLKNLLKKFKVLLIKVSNVLSPEFLWFMHKTPLKSSRLQLRRVLFKWTKFVAMQIVTTNLCNYT